MKYYGQQGHGIALQEPRKEVEVILKKNVVPLTIGQRTLQWFMFRRGLITGTAAQAFARYDNETRKLIYASPDKRHPGELSDETIQDKLISGWFYMGDANRKESYYQKVGRLNEGGVVQELQRKPFVSKIFEVGLVRCREETNSSLGVSADNIIVVVPPKQNKNDPEARILATLEIKTKCSKKTLGAAENTKRTYFATEDYIFCKAGSPLWFATIPLDYRGQILHQACVFDLDHAVFCMASRTHIIYTVLILVSPDMRSKWRSALKRPQLFANILWKNHSNDYDRIMPGAFEDSDCAKWTDQGHMKVLDSWYPMWRAFHLQREAEGGLMRPCRSYRHLGQMHYSKHKQGLDGICDIEEKFSSRALRFNYDQKVTIRLFLDFVVGVAGLWRIYSVMYTKYDEKDSDHAWWKGLTAFRRQMSKECTYADFIYELVFQMLIIRKARPNEAEDEEHDVEIPSQNTSTAKALTTDEHTNLVHEFIKKPEKRQRESAIGRSQQALYQSELKRLRLAVGPHNKVQVKPPKVHGTSCPLCGQNPGYGCSYCMLPLCTRLKANAAKSCWDKWHSSQKVQGTTQQKTKKKK
jgi:hypothetical protein